MGEHMNTAGGKDRVEQNTEMRRDSRSRVDLDMSAMPKRQQQNRTMCRWVKGEPTVGQSNAAGATAPQAVWLALKSA